MTIRWYGAKQGVISLTLNTLFSSRSVAQSVSQSVGRSVGSHTLHRYRPSVHWLTDWLWVIITSQHGTVLEEGLRKVKESAQQDERDGWRQSSIISSSRLVSTRLVSRGRWGWWDDFPYPSTSQVHQTLSPCSPSTLILSFPSSRLLF